VSLDARLDVNVALNRPSYQISTYVNLISYDAKYANDGGHGTHLTGGPCAATRVDTNPWWAVDLAVELYVAGVKFTIEEMAGVRMQSFPCWFNPLPHGDANRHTIFKRKN